MTSGAGISMRPAGVSQVGRQLQAKATQAKQYVSRQFASSGTAARHNAGWLSADALRCCRDAWHQQLDTLVDRTRKIGEDLDAAAATADAGDKEAAKRIGRVLTGLTPFR